MSVTASSHPDSYLPRHIMKSVALHRGVDFASEQIFQDDRLHSGTRDGWAKISKLLRQHDERKIQNCKEDIDTLLVFAGLFSAVLTAFVVESYTTLQEDPTDASAQMLVLISLQLQALTASTNVSNEIISSFTPAPFRPSSSALWINGFWFSSLVCSLITASFGILVKQWLREYMMHDSLSPRAEFRVRNFRYTGLVQGGVFELAALLPVLLQCSLLLFFIGLSRFLRDLSPGIGWVVTALIACWLLFFVVTTLAPICWSQCPYKTPILLRPLKAGRSGLYIGWNWIRSGATSIRKRFRRAGFSTHHFTRIGILPQMTLQAFRKLWESITGSFEWWYFCYVEQNIHPSRPFEEDQIRMENYHDIDFLVAADNMFQDDELLEPIGDCLLDVDFTEASECIRRIIKERRNASAKPTKLQSIAWGSPSATRLRSVMAKVLRRQIDILLAETDGELQKWTKQMHEGLMFILTCPAPHPEPRVREFVHWMIGLGKVGAGAVLIALCSRYRYPIHDFAFRDLDDTCISNILQAAKELTAYADADIPSIPTHYNGTVLPVRSDMVKMCHHVISLIGRNIKVIEQYQEDLHQVQMNIESVLHKYRAIDGQFIDAAEIVVSARQKLAQFGLQAPCLVRSSLLVALDMFLPDIGSC
ncbi:hypothetical protein QCA50_007603 [Cerrena zonata]|uniref:DUF6535 domain-containing protein n=1 Tax=Cerrena zonata TaxID=2478898 RepID=A0AAW0G907_9APHY